MECLEIGHNFYEEHEEIAALSPQQVHDLRRKLGLKASGHLVPKVCTIFGGASALQSWRSVRTLCPAHSLAKAPPCSPRPRLDVASRARTPPPSVQRRTPHLKTHMGEPEPKLLSKAPVTESLIH